METVTSMIKWKLKDVMDERGIKSKRLAKEMHRHSNKS